VIVRLGAVVSAGGCLMTLIVCGVESLPAPSFAIAVIGLLLPTVKEKLLNVQVPFWEL